VPVEPGDPEALQQGFVDPDVVLGPQVDHGGDAVGGQGRIALGRRSGAPPQRVVDLGEVLDGQVEGRGARSALGQQVQAEDGEVRQDEHPHRERQEPYGRDAGPPPAGGARHEERRAGDDGSGHCGFVGRRAVAVEGNSGRDTGSGCWCTTFTYQRLSRAHRVHRHPRSAAVCTPPWPAESNPWLRAGSSAGYRPRCGPSGAAGTAGCWRPRRGRGRGRQGAAARSPAGVPPPPRRGRRAR